MTDGRYAYEVADAQELTEKRAGRRVTVTRLRLIDLADSVEEEDPGPWMELQKFPSLRLVRSAPEVRPAEAALAR